MKLPPHFIGRIFAVVAGTIVLYVILGATTGWHDFRAEMAAFPKRYILPLILLSLFNYLLRYGRWELYLCAVQIHLPRKESLALFFATFVMVITPGKLGEAFKAAILWERYKIPLSRGLPIILAERLFDFLAIFILACVGLLFWTGPFTGMTVAFLMAILVPLGLIALRSRSVRQWLIRRASSAPYLQRYRFGLEEALKSLTHLLRGRVTGWSLLLSSAAWAAECVSLWLVCQASGTALSLFDSFFIYAAGTLVGSLTFLPGGLGGTEVTLIGLLRVQGVPTDTAVSIALIVRAVTLWLAVGIGLAVFGANHKTILGKSAPPAE